MATVIPLTAPDITQVEIDAVTDVLRTGMLTEGPRLDQFERSCAQTVGRREAVGVCSGTAAIYCSLLGTGIAAGDEVISSPFSFVATTHCILMVGAKPVFADIHPKTLNIDPAALEAAITPRTKAIIAVEALGHPGAIDQIEQIARRHELVLIENAAEALGGRHSGRPLGSFGRASCFSFHPNKQITAGEGGMMLTDDDRLAAYCRSLRNHGRNGSPRCVRMGFSYRMSEMNAALGLAQLSRLDEIVDKRRRVARAYFQRLMDNRYVSVPTIAEDDTMSWYLFDIRLNDLFEYGDRDLLIREMREEGVECGSPFDPVHLHPHIAERAGTQGGMFPVCEYIAGRTLALPMFASMALGQIDHVCEALDRAIEKVLMGRCKGRF